MVRYSPPHPRTLPSPLEGLDGYQCDAWGGSAGEMQGDGVPQGLTRVGVPCGSLQPDLKPGAC